MRLIGIYLMITAILIGTYLLFNVYLPGVVVPRDNRWSSGLQAAPEGRTLKGATPQQWDDNTVILARYERPHQQAPAYPFDVPRGLEKIVSFWKAIYSKYTSDQAVIHNKDDFKIIKVVDLPHCNEPPSEECLKRREEVVEGEKERLAGSLVVRHSSFAPSPSPSPIKGEGRGGGRTTNYELRTTNTLRAQIGQKDRFIAGINASRELMPIIEEIFANYNIPKELTRMVFVESMFNLKAKSKSGAAGIWQFTKPTGRLYLTIDRRVDERYDPIASTHAAAQLLKKNHEELGTWPLAINAYNSGRNLLKDAVSTLGTRDITAIIRKYDHPSYGFASRNFYPSFLAVLNVYENRGRYFGEEMKDENK